MGKDDPAEIFNKWFDSSESWEKDLVNRLWDHNLTDEERRNCYELYSAKDSKLDVSNPMIDFGVSGIDITERIFSISSLQNIGAINEGSGIEFSEESNIHVIYGKNGSGKSTYVTLMKNICGSNRNERKVLGNVFKEDSPLKATITYEKNGNKKNFDWTNAGACPDLKNLEIFDSDYRDTYLGSDAPAIYEPKALFLISKMGGFYDDFKMELGRKKRSMEGVISYFPLSYLETEWGIKFRSASCEDDIEALEEAVFWTDEDQNRLNYLNELLSASDPQSSIDRIEREIECLKKYISEFKRYYEAYSDEVRDSIVELKEEVILSREITRAAEKEFEGLSIPGVGNEVWKEMWNIAKKYSEEYAYPRHEFPCLENGSVCVLCQQRLDQDAKERFITFKEYVNSQAEKNLTDADAKLKGRINALLQLPLWESIELDMTKNAVPSTIISMVKLFYNILNSRFKELSAPDNVKTDTFLFGQVFFEKWIQSLIKRLELQRVEYTEAIKEKAVYVKEKYNISAKKWLCENKKIIQAKGEILWVEKLIESTNTVKVSRLNTRLSKILITEEFRTLFNKELEDIGANHLKIEMEHKTKGTKLNYRIVLKDPLIDESAKNILSEGERKAVVFAAFITELKLNKSKFPFIFDDPTNSLDNDYEENIANKLIEISKERQVIVFTHRLPIITYLIEKNEGQNVHYMQLHSKILGGLEPRARLTLEKVNQKMIDFMLDEANKLDNLSPDEYESEKNSLCTDVRKVIERSVESVLFDDIVVRHRRVIKTMKLRRIDALKSEDTKMINDLMTKYSIGEHPQTGEAPFTGFTAESIRKDLKTLGEWIRGYNRRKDEIEEQLKCKLIY